MPGQKLPSLSQVLAKGGSSSRLPSLEDVLSGNHVQPQPKAKHGGGLLHDVVHGAEKVVGKTASDLYDTAIHTPSGLYTIGKAVATGNTKQLKQIARATGEGFVQDFQHPLRHPGNTLLDVGALLSLGAGTAARVGEAARVADEGGNIASALVRGPKPQPREIAYGGEKIQAGNYSRTASRRAAQKLYDQFQQRFPDVRLPLRNLHERVGHELSADRAIIDRIGRAPAHALAKIKLSKPEQKALQVVAEGVPVDERILFHKQQLSKLNGKLAAATRKELALLKAAKKYVHDVNGVPRIRPDNERLANVYEEAKSLAHQREQVLYGTKRLARAKGRVVRAKALSEEAAANRVEQPAAIIRGEIGHTKYGFDPELVPELFRFPYKTTGALPALGKMAGYKGGIPKTPGTLTHEYTGALLKSGAFRNDTTRLVAESYLEAHRFAALMKHRDQFLSLAHDEKLSPNDIPIRSDALLNKAWPKVLEDLSEKPALTKGDVEALGRYYEDVRNHTFPTEEIVRMEERLLGAAKHPDVKYIDKRVLGGLNRPNPLVGFAPETGAGKGLRVFDAINNASRAAILYLKPAYAAPNILGNAALNIVQQGWAAPRQIGSSVRLFHKLDRETREKVKLAMGEGVTGALHSEAGPASKAINKMAELWQKPVDTPFRLNAFFYEARKQGFKTPAQIKALFDDEPKLLRVAREANGAIIDYSRLGPFEQNVIRRVIFFYPWVKGSSTYAGRFLAEHPYQAALAGQIGKQGAAKDAAELGPLPSYAEGLFKVGDRNGMPLVVNPNSAGVLQTPAQLGKAIAELGSQHPGEAFQLAQNLTPAAVAALALLTNYGATRGQSPISNAKSQLVGGLPLVTTVEQTLHPPSQATRPRVYPRTRRDVIAKYLVGGLAPTPLNKSKAHAAKYSEDHPH